MNDSLIDLQSTPAAVCADCVDVKSFMWIFAKCQHRGWTGDVAQNVTFSLLGGGQNIRLDWV